MGPITAEVNARLKQEPTGFRPLSEKSGRLTFTKPGCSGCGVTHDHLRPEIMDLLRRSVTLGRGTGFSRVTRFAIGPTDG